MNNCRKKTFYEALIKRLLDFALAFVGLVLLSPLFLIIALLVRIAHGKGVIFKQKRVGRNAKVFWFYKFRSMSNKRDEFGELLPDRERLTKFGKFLRKSSLDEIPQLWNILKGDMSFIGPRPRDIKECVFLTAEQCQRFAVRPGVSGLAQVNGRNSIGLDEVTEYDLRYIEKVTLWRDIKIFIKTFFVVFKRKGIESKVKAVNLGEYYGDKLLRCGEISKQDYDELISFSKTVNAGDVLSSVRNQMLATEILKQGVQEVKALDSECV